MQTANTLVVGATPNPTRYAFMATHRLLEHGFPVILFGIKKGEIAGLPIQNQWPDEPIDTITLYIGKRWQESYYDQILGSKARRIIFNPGTENPELMEKAESAGIECLEACTLVLLQMNSY